MAAPTPYRTSRPVRLLLFGLGGLLAVAMVAWGGAHALDRLSIQEERVVASYPGVEAIDLRHASGDVTLVRAAGSRVRVEVETRRGFLAGHGRSAELVGGELRLRGSCDLLALGTCEDDYRIAVPAGVAVTVRTAAGEASAVGLRGRLDLHSNAGVVTGRDLRGRRIALSSRAGGVTADRVRATSLWLQTRAGGLRVTRGVVEELEARASAGPVEATLLRPPRQVDARSTAGPVTVTVPDVGYYVEAATAAGPADVTVRQSRRASRTIKVDSKAGPVAVRPLPPGAALSAPARPRRASAPAR